MNILVTGANGLLGQALVSELCSEHNVYAIVGENSKIIEQIKLKLLHINLANIDVTLLPENIDVIYYLAQSNHFREFPEMSMDILDINVYAPVMLASWAKENGVKKFIYTSSGGVYKHPVAPVKEIFEINANEKNGFYLDSKLSAEILLRNFANYFETFVIVRPFFMYGPAQNSSMLIPRLIQNIIDKNEIILSDENGIKINPIYIKDAVKSMKDVLKLRGEHLFNLAGTEVVSLRELCEIISKIVQATPKYKVLKNSQADLIADISKMKDYLYTPQINLKKGLELTYKAMKR